MLGDSEAGVEGAGDVEGTCEAPSESLGEGLGVSLGGSLGEELGLSVGPASAGGPRSLAGAGSGVGAADATVDPEGAAAGRELAVTLAYDPDPESAASATKLTAHEPTTQRPTPERTRRGRTATSRLGDHLGSWEPVSRRAVPKTTILRNPLERHYPPDRPSPVACRERRCGPRDRHRSVDQRGPARTDVIRDRQDRDAGARSGRRRPGGRHLGRNVDRRRRDRVDAGALAAGGRNAAIERDPQRWAGRSEHPTWLARPEVLSVPSHTRPGTRTRPRRTHQLRHDPMPGTCVIPPPKTVNPCSDPALCSSSGLQTAWPRDAEILLRY